ncbi:MAG: hypothetical protein ACRDAM_12490, partial [Casimicrobium sp.]
TGEEIQHLFDRKRKQFAQTDSNREQSIHLFHAGVSIGASMIGGKSLAEFNAAMRAADAEMNVQKQKRKTGDERGATSVK